MRQNPSLSPLPGETSSTQGLRGANPPWPFQTASSASAMLRLTVYLRDELSHYGSLKRQTRISRYYLLTPRCMEGLHLLPC